jgi:hypothetical protein
VSTINMDPTQIGARLRSDASGLPRALTQAMFSGAQRGRSWILDKTPIDRGILKNAWRVLKSSQLVELVNDQPYAGVMERGARPFKISKEGIIALAGWVKRKILSSGLETLAKHGLVGGTKTSRKAAVSWAARRQRVENKQANKMPRGSYGPKRDTGLRSLKGTISSQTANQVSEIEKEAMSIAYAIAANFKKVGIRGRFFVRDNLEILAGLMDSEMERFLDKFFNRSLGSGE